MQYFRNMKKKNMLVGCWQRWKYSWQRTLAGDKNIKYDPKTIAYHKRGQYKVSQLISNGLIGFMVLLIKSQNARCGLKKTVINAKSTNWNISFYETSLLGISFCICDGVFGAFGFCSLVFGTLCLVIWSQYALAVLQCPLCVITSKLMSHCAEDFGD